MSEKEKVIIDKIKEVGQRKKTVEGLNWGIIFAFYGCFVSVMLLAADKFLYFSFPPALFFLPIPTAFVLAFLFSMLRKLPLTEAAQTADHNLQLKERLSASLEFIEKKDSSRVVTALINDTASHAEQIEAKKAVPLKLAKELKFFVIPLILAVALVFVPHYTTSQAVEQKKTEQLIKSEGAKLEVLANKLLKKAEDQKLPRLENIAKTIKQESLNLQKNKVQPKEAFAKINKLKDLLQKEKEELSKSSKFIEELKKHKVTKPVAKELEKDNVKKAEEKLKKLADKAEKNKLSPQEQAELKKALKEATKNLPSGELKEKLDQALKSMDKNDLKDTAKMLKDASKCLSCLKKDKDAEKMLKDALKNLQDTQKKLGGQKGSEGLKEMEQQEKNLSELEYEKTNKKGKIDAGKSSTNKEEENKKAVQPKKNFSERQTEKSSLKKDKYSKIYAPKRTETKKFIRKSSVNIGKGNPTGYTESKDRPQIGEKAYLPYDKVYKEYQKSAEEALTKENVPLVYRQLIKKYFNELEPKEGKN